MLGIVAMVIVRAIATLIVPVVAMVIDIIVIVI